MFIHVFVLGCYMLQKQSRTECSRWKPHGPQSQTTYYLFPHIPVLRASISGRGHRAFPQWKSDREPTQLASPTPHNSNEGMVLRKMRVVRSLPWSRGRATGRHGMRYKGHFLFLGAAPTHRSTNHQHPGLPFWAAPSDSLQRFPF